MIDNKEVLLNKEKNSINGPEKFDQFYYGHGKLLLSGEYFVLDGAKSLAVPTTVGQSMGVRYGQSFSPKLTWKSFDVNGNLWFEGQFEFWQFKCVDEVVSEESLVIQKLLLQARAQNKHFLREHQDVYVETQLGFPLSWGLGSSSSLIHNIAQWAYISPFELLFNTFDGSGYDVACAQSDGPITYEKNISGPKWGPTTFMPSFMDKLSFIYLGNKQSSIEGIKLYRSKERASIHIINEVSKLTGQMMKAKTLTDFCDALEKHEKIVGDFLGLEPVKTKYFSDFNGSIKSLGAWGGDFILVSSDESFDNVKKYFAEKGHNVVFTYDELILKTPSLMPNHDCGHQVH